MAQKPTYEELEKRIKALESKQLKNAAFFRRIIDLIPSCIIVKNRDGQFVLVNEKTATFYGSDVESMIGRYEYEYANLHPSNAAEIEKFLADDRAVIDFEKMKTIPEEAFTTANGERLNFNVTKIPISTFGYENCVLVIATDISEQKQAKAAIQESEKKYRTLFENAGEAIFLHDLDGNLVDVNPECCNLYGYSRDQFITMNVNQIDSPEDRHFFKERLKHLKEKGSVKFQAVHVNSNNEKIINDCNVRLIDYNGKKMMLGIARNITDIKKTEDALKKSELLHKKAQKVAHIGHWELSSPSDAPVWSEEIYRIFGLNPDKDAPSFSEHKTIIHPNDWPHLEKAITQLNTNGIPFNLQLKIMHANGEIRWLHALGKAEKNEEGHVKRMFGTAQDITDLKRTEIALKESKQMLSIHLENTPIVAIVWNLKFEIMYLNPAAEKIFGYTKAEAIGKHGSELIVPGYIKEDIHAVFQKLLTETGGTRNTNENITKDGKTILCEWYNTPLKIEEKGIIGVASFVHDITERRAIEKALQESEKKYREIFHNSSDTIFIHDAQTGAIVDVNKTTCDVFGYTHDEFKSLRVSDLSLNEPPFTNIEAVQWIHRAMKEGPQKFEWLAKDRNNKLIWFENSLLHARIAGKDRVLVFGRNIDERKKLEDQILIYQKMESIGTLAGGIAHDFNNMLSVISGNVSYVLECITHEQDIKEALLDVQESVKQGSHLTRQLITFAKGGAPIKKPVQINKLIKEAAKLVLRGASSSCDFHFTRQPWPVEGDEGQLNQVLSNVIINANQAMPEGGIIKIELINTFMDNKTSLPMTAGPFVKIKITDQGIGIPDKHLSKIFDPFFTTKHKGSGLGLASSFSIIRKHGGHISVASELGKGTTFTIYLPATEKVAKSEETLETKHKGHGKILIMDDQEHLLKMADRMLREMGYDVFLSNDGSQAIEMYLEAFQSSEPFDLSILDLTVPGGMGGARAIHELLKINPNAKVVVSSGYSNDPIMGDYQRYGFCGVLQKPYSTNQMAELLNMVLGEKD